MHRVPSWPARATVHGIYDVWLGGSSSLALDREAAAAIEARFPAMPRLVRDAHDFSLRAAAWSAAEGTRRFIRWGATTCLPGRNVYDAVRQAAPGARVRVLYLNLSPDADAMARSLLAGRDGTAAARAPLGNPAKALRLPEVAEMLGGGEPVCLVLPMLWHLVSPRSAARRIGVLTRALPPGSHLVLSLLADGCPADVAELSRLLPARAWHHTSAGAASWLSGLDVLPPGVADVRVLPLRPWGALESCTCPAGRAVGAIGRKR